MRIIALALLFLGGCASQIPPFHREVGYTTNTGQRVWIDSDPACSALLTTADPDDCLAYLLALRAKLPIIGMSIVGGNARENDTWQTAIELVGDTVPLHRGIGGCSSDAVSALRQTSEQGWFRVIALGPLSNIATFIRCYPESAQSINDIVFVGARYEHQKFIPNPDRPLTIELDDLNVKEDPEAVRVVLQSGIPLSYVPFEAGAKVAIPWSLLADAKVVLPEYIDNRLRDWSIVSSIFLGTDGFLPFDALAVAYALWEAEFSCETVRSEVVLRELIVKKEEGGTKTKYCVPKNPSRLRNRILSTL